VSDDTWTELYGDRSGTSNSPKKVLIKIDKIHDQALVEGAEAI
jgi:hypothetical protein